MESLWIEITLAVIILALLSWIYYIKGWNTDRRDLIEEKRELEDRILSLEQTNETLRESLSSTADRTSRPLKRILSVAQDLIKVRDAGLGSRKARVFIEDKYDTKLSPVLIKKVLSSIDNVNPPLKRRLAHEILVGDIGRYILKSINEGKSLNRAAEKSGVPLRVVKQRARLLKETGYLDNKLNLTELGNEALNVY